MVCAECVVCVCGVCMCAGCVYVCGVLCGMWGVYVCVCGIFC